MLGLLAIVTLFVCAHANTEVESITSHGYAAESHTVTTSDGYILEIFRILHGKNSKRSNGNVVLLMHGCVLGSNSFTYLGPSSGIAYNLADAGYDVWMANIRGNKYSRRHTSLDPDKDSKQFFDFSYEDIALYDLPTTIDYVLATTKRDKLHYIGHSQGGTVFFVLNSLNTAYQSKIASAHLMAAPGYQKEFPNQPVKLLTSAIDAIYDLTLLTGYVELKPSPLTALLLVLFVNSTVPQELIAGGAVKSLVHYCQNFRDGSFKRWNYGAVKNSLKYGRISPPSYDLSKIKVDITLYYSLSDTTQSERDVMDMVHAMPNARAHKVARSSFDHMGYVSSKDVKELVTDYIIESLKKHKN